MKTLESHRCFGGTLGVYEHDSASTGTPMRLSVFVPQQAEHEKRPAVIYLSGLTCTEQNFTTKAGAYRVASELGLVVIAPDTSPRGEGVPDGETYETGQGASFYLNATQAPWKQHFQMESYVTEDLVQLVSRNFRVDEDKIGIMGHSMGGHGALVLWQRHPKLFKSVSALAPVCAPTQSPWGDKAFRLYLGDDTALWADYDATELMLKQQDAASNPAILIDQGAADEFLAERLHPLIFADACKRVGQKLRLHMREGYDHSYYFVQSFIDDHLRHHAEQLK